ncbi:MAG TPA: hypothetical protein VIO60_11775 [Rectinemataceae bacterium]
MKKAALLIVLLLLIAFDANAQSPSPSGVWSTGKYNYTHTMDFSWGSNPVNLEVNIIDLGAIPPYIVVSSQSFTVVSYLETTEGFVFFGDWGSDKVIPGLISIKLSADGNSLCFVDIFPERYQNLIKRDIEEWFVRVPQDAPVVPIGENGP